MRWGFGLALFLALLFGSLFVDAARTDTSTIEVHRLLVKPGPIRVVVMDTGTGAHSSNLCPTGHMDFTARGLRDTQSHGATVLRLITDTANLPSTAYCIIVVKFFGPSGYQKAQYLSALKYIASINPDIVNFSFGGPELLREEALLIEGMLDRGVLLVAAAGNESQNLNRGCVYYPACIDARIFVIGSTTSTVSNFGRPVDFLMPGTVWVQGSKAIEGTSFSAARFTGTLVRKAFEYKKKFRIAGVK